MRTHQDVYQLKSVNSVMFSDLYIMKVVEIVCQKQWGNWSMTGTFTLCIVHTVNRGLGILIHGRKSDTVFWYYKKKTLFHFQRMVGTTFGRILGWPFATKKIIFTQKELFLPFSDRTSALEASVFLGVFRVRVSSPVLTGLN